MLILLPFRRNGRCPFRHDTDSYSHTAKVVQLPRLSQDVETTTDVRERIYSP
jgi:hypothetical protein